MTSRLYATALALVLFFLTWAVVAAQPWSSGATAGDPRLKALALREASLRREAKRIDRVVARRTRVAAAATRVAPAAVRVVTLPPLTITRTS